MRRPRHDDGVYNKTSTDRPQATGEVRGGSAFKPPGRDDDEGERRACITKLNSRCRTAVAWRRRSCITKPWQAEPATAAWRRRSCITKPWQAEPRRPKGNVHV